MKPLIEEFKDDFRVKSREFDSLESLGSIYHPTAQSKQYLEGNYNPADCQD